VVHLGKQGGDQVDLPADLGAAEHRDERALGPVQRVAQVAQLLLHQQAGHRRLEHPRHRLGAGVGPVRRAERVVHVEVAQRREAGPQLGVVGLLAGEEAGVLRDGHASPGKPAALGDRRIGERVPQEGDG
jgi:hypothetical protein